MLQEIRIIPVVVIEKAECQETGKKKRREQTWCIPKSEGEGKKYYGDAENLESTWREAVCAGRNLTLCYHMVKAKFRLWMPPSKLVFLLQRPFGSKGNFTSNKKASRLCFLLACPVSLPPPALCKVMTKKKKKKRVPDGEYSQVAVWPLCFPPASLRSPTVTTGLCSTPDARFCL